VKDTITNIKESDEKGKKASTTIEKSWKVENNNSDEIEKEVYIYLVKENTITKDSILIITYSNLFASNFETTMLHSDKSTHYHFIYSVKIINYKNRRQTERTWSSHNTHDKDKYIFI
jgi:hypothetical protein